MLQGLSLTWAKESSGIANGTVKADSHIACRAHAVR
jgi:hypothetical protein